MILLIGSSSMAGYNIHREFPGEVVPVCHRFNRTRAARKMRRVDLDRPREMAPILEGVAPTCVIYCHAVCDVEKSESEEAWTYDVNVGNLAAFMELLPAATRLVYVSSDHVFGGDGVYHESSAPCPISVYGRSRVEAEKLVLARESSLVVRAPLSIGPSINGRSGHRDWLIYRHRRGFPITIVEDEYRSAVMSRDLARRIYELAQSDVTTIRHIAAKRAVSRLELAEHMKKCLGLEGLQYEVRSRFDFPYPHLGRVDLRSEFDEGLRSVVEVVDV